MRHASAPAHVNVRVHVWLRLWLCMFVRVCVGRCSEMAWGGVIRGMGGGATSAAPSPPPPPRTCTSFSPSAAPSTVADRSLPPRPSVVMARVKRPLARKPVTMGTSRGAPCARVSVCFTCSGRPGGRAGGRGGERGVERGAWPGVPPSRREAAVGGDQGPARGKQCKASVGGEDASSPPRCAHVARGTRARRPPLPPAPPTQAARPPRPSLAGGGELLGRGPVSHLWQGLLIVDLRVAKVIRRGETKVPRVVLPRRHALRGARAWRSGRGAVRGVCKGGRVPAGRGRRAAGSACGFRRWRLGAAAGPRDRVAAAAAAARPALSRKVRARTRARAWARRYDANMRVAMRSPKDTRLSFARAVRSCAAGRRGEGGAGSGSGPVRGAFGRPAGDARTVAPPPHPRPPPTTSAGCPRAVAHALTVKHLQPAEK